MSKLGWAAFVLLGIVAAATDAATYDDSGEYEFRLTLDARALDGAFPAVLEAPGGAIDGVLHLQVDRRGRATGRLATSGGEVVLVGRQSGGDAGQRVTLKSADRRLRIRARSSGAALLGTFRDDGALTVGRGAVRVDVSAAPQLRIDVAAATRNSLKPTRRGHGTAEIGTATLPLIARTRTGFPADRVRFSGDGFVFTGRGTLGASSFTFTSWTCATHGLVLHGAQGYASFSPNGPDVVLVTASGHPVGVASDADPYLRADAGLYLADWLRWAGYSTKELDYVDYHFATAYGPGYEDMVAGLELVRDTWVNDRVYPSTVVVVAHSHGGVRAHMALEEVSDLPVGALIDLDTSSCLFNTGHALEPTPDPVSARLVGAFWVDVEDVVPDSVAWNLDVFGDDSCLGLGFEAYNDRVNVRADGSVRGIYTFESGESHGSVHAVGSRSMTEAAQWLLYVLDEVR